MCKSLKLTEDEFEVLNELVSDTIDEMDENELEKAGVPLKEYEIFHVFQKLNSLKT